MGRFMDFVVVLIAIFGFAVMQVSGAVILDELRTSLLDTQIDSEYNATENFNDMFTAVTKWAPLTGLIGTLGLVFYREYRRQRIAAQRRGLQ